MDDRNVPPKDLILNDTTGFSAYSVPSALKDQLWLQTQLMFSEVATQLHRTRIPVCHSSDANRLLTDKRASQLRLEKYNDPNLIGVLFSP